MIDLRSRTRLVGPALVWATLGAGSAAAQSPLPAGSAFIPIAPCRIVDTRLSTILVAGTARTFHVVGSASNFAVQGGTAGGCAIPGYSGGPQVTGVMFDLVAVGAAGPGNLRAWPADQAVPNASVLNYTAGLNLANGIALPVSQDATEGNDLSIRADVSDVHVVVDVVGYFARPFEVSHRRYVVEAGPAQVGVVVPLDVPTVDQLCRDDDGCQVTLQMVNWNAVGEPGNVASRSVRLFISKTSRWWRTSGDVFGLDGNGTLDDYTVYDCRLTDAEVPVAGANQRADTDAGFALLNQAGGGYSDATVTCRIAIED